MKQLIVFAILLSSFTALAHELTPVKDGIQEMESAVGRAGLPPQCATCEGRADESGSGGLYSLQVALSDLKSSPLKFLGRDYPSGSLGAGGNLSCFFKNDKVYVELEGCRPNRTQRMTAFRAKIYNLDGRLIDVYLDNENDPFPLDAPRTSRGFTITSSQASPVPAGLAYRQLSDRIEAEAKNYSKPMCYYSLSGGACRNGGSDSGSIREDFQNPGSMVRQLHDAIMAVPR